MKNKKTLIFILLIVLFSFSFQTIAFAGDIDAGDWKPNGDPLDNTTKKVAGIIIGAITNVGSVVAVLALIIIGIRFALGSVEERAQYKESLKPYLIGAFLLFAILQIVESLYNIGMELV